MNLFDDPSSVRDLLGISQRVPEKTVGIYFLLRGDLLLYIGRSIANVWQRIFSHQFTRYGMDFDRFVVLPCPIEKCQDEGAETAALREIEVWCIAAEAKYISHFLPPLNRCHLVKGLRTPEQQAAADKVPRMIDPRDFAIAREVVT